MPWILCFVVVFSFWIFFRVQFLSSSRSSYSERKSFSQYWSFSLLVLYYYKMRDVIEHPILIRSDKMARKLLLKMACHQYSIAIGWDKWTWHWYLKTDPRWVLDGSEVNTLMFILPIGTTKVNRVVSTKVPERKEVLNFEYVQKTSQVWPGFKFHKFSDVMIIVICIQLNLSQMGRPSGRGSGCAWNGRCIRGGRWLRSSVLGNFPLLALALSNDLSIHGHFHFIADVSLTVSKRFGGSENLHTNDDLII